ncbi:MAG: ribbon-helix-helix domain-containing protein [Candidatus Dormibacteraeota bacterium]|nr:ribbon-helix-helix domain-containing protein [Candidatus Dormibacteraeota bacterium]
MRRFQVYMEDGLDDRLEAEARRRGVSKARVVRDAVNRDLGMPAVEPPGPWQAMTGWLELDPVENIDDVIYRVGS